jgi:NAD(P)H-dependent flavin oxidoreductase YrpB (nitropropane dioxygenase family)
LGVVSGTALEVVCARRLQDGDPGGDVRRALAHFPLPGAAERILRTYYIAGGKAPGAAYRPVLRSTLQPARALQELTVAANFVEVFLAKEGHHGPVGINYLRKIELPIPFACYGAMLAGVDHVLVGAGNPADLPLLLDRLTGHEPVALPVRVQGATSADGDFAIHFDPRELAHGTRPVLHRPRLDAIVASVDLATALVADPATRPDGFIVEGYTAGGHNAPPRGPRRLDPRGQPHYDERDTVHPQQMAGLGIPFWMAGSYATPAGLAHAVSSGAAGIQVGTAFALCRESGMADEHKHRLLDQAAHGQVSVRTDGRASPTGFPFKIAELAGTLAADQVYADRQRILRPRRAAQPVPQGRRHRRLPLPGRTRSRLRTPRRTGGEHSRSRLPVQRPAGHRRPRPTAPRRPRRTRDRHHRHRLHRRARPDRPAARRPTHVHRPRRHHLPSRPPGECRRAPPCIGSFGPASVREGVLTMASRPVGRRASVG